MPPVVELPSAVSDILQRKGREAAEEGADVEPEFLAAADDDGAELSPKLSSESNGSSNGSSKKGKKKRGASPKPSPRKPTPTKPKNKTSPKKSTPAHEDEEGEVGGAVAMHARSPSREASDDVDIRTTPGSPIKVSEGSRERENER